MPASSRIAARATWREWIGLAVIALPCMVYAMDLTVLNLALPTISAELKPSAPQQLWIIDIYGFLVAGFLITMGTLGDRIGRRRLLLAGAAAFAAASAAAAFARSAEWLIAMRALLGIAGATVAPSTLSLIRNMFHDARQRQFALGVWVAAYSLGATIGPLVGGALLQAAGWGAVFLMAVPVMALLLVLGPWLLPEYRDPQAGRIDGASVAQSIAAVLAVIYALKEFAAHGWQPAAAVLLLAGLAVGTAFVRRQRRLPYPLLDLTLFRSPAFSGAIAAYGLSSLAMFGVYIFVAQYLQGVRGLSPLQAGLLTVPGALAFLVGSLATPRLARRVAPTTLIVAGLALSALGFVLVMAAGTQQGLPALVAGNVVMSLAMAPVFTVGNELILTAAPPERAGAASALSETSSEFSGALGIALFGSFGTWLYDRALSTTLPPQLPAADAATARATVSGAMAVAQSLPAGLQALVRDAAQAAFVDTLRLTALVGAATVTAAAVVAGRLMRSARRG